MDPLRMVGLIGASCVVVLLCLGLGWWPATTTAPERLALLGLAITGLVWPFVVLGLVGRDQRLNRIRPLLD